MIFAILPAASYGEARKRQAVMPSGKKIRRVDERHTPPPLLPLTPLPARRHCR